MKNLIYTLSICFLFPSFLSAQYLEVGAGFGSTSYLGDLSPSTKRLSMGEQRYAVNGFVRYNPNDYLALKIGATLGRLSARDVDAEDASRKARALQFKSVLFETAVTLEYNIFGYEPKYMSRRFSPYVFIGVGFFTFNPKTIYGGEWVELQPLGTEGQGLADFPEKKPYKRFAFSFPIGGGLKYAVSDRLNIGGEIGLRGTTTDYIDDVSTTYVSSDVLNENNGPVSAALSNRSGKSIPTGATRGNPNNNDWYLVSSLSISYNLINSGNKRRRRPMGCPTF